MSETVKKFLSFYEKNHHKIMPSSNVIDNEDKSILFVNSGMVQFKDFFLGKKPSIYKNITTCQKCIRAGGKHNDFDNIGHTNRHHTFFEMLGNFSFGGYFKKEAINYAWELLTNEFKIDPKRLFVTIYWSERYKDEESFHIWSEIFTKFNSNPQDYIIKVPTSDNFWQMGHDGLCGPCTEIYYDYKPELGLKNLNVIGDDKRFIEIYNVVFMQFNKIADKFEDLPVKCVDTGMGLERIEAVLSGNNDGNNYISGKLLEISKKLHSEMQNLKKNIDFNLLASEKEFKVVVDHIRSIVFILSEKVLPSNKKQGYILKKLMKKLILNLNFLINKFAQDFNNNDEEKLKIIQSLAKYSIEIYSERYPELSEINNFIDEILESEYTLFTKVLDKALKIFNEEMEKVLKENDKKNRIFSGKIAFELEDTYGLDVEILKDLCKKYSIEIDEKEFEKNQEEQKKRSKESNKDFFENGENDSVSKLVCRKFGVKNKIENSISFNEYDKKKTELSYYNDIENDSIEAEILDIINNDILLFDKTIFYPEGGGQIYDTGSISFNGKSFNITNVQKINDYVYHKIDLKSENSLKIGNKVLINVDIKRRNNIRINHSSTHILHHLLRVYLGEIVEQKGSFLNERYLTFDFSYHKSVDSQIIRKIENDFNEIISQKIETKILLKNLKDAKEMGALSLDVKNYSEEVRVVQIGDSIALCGGLHIKNTSDIRFCKIISEVGIGSGTRRITAITNDEVVKMMYYNENTVSKIATLFNNGSIYKFDEEFDPEIVKNCEKLISEKKEIENLYKNSVQTLIKRSIDSTEKTEKNGFSFRYVKIENVDLNLFNHSVLKSDEKEVIILSNGKILKIITINPTESLNSKKIIEFFKKNDSQIKGGGTESFANIMLENSTNELDLVEKIKNLND